MEMSRSRAIVAADGRRETLLIVDDLPEIAHSLQVIMRRALGPRALIEIETDAARALARVSVERFDVIVSDLRMPRVDGARLLAVARDRNPEGRRILFTAYFDAAAGARRELDLTALIPKPATRAEIERVILCALRGRRAAPHA